MIQFRCPVCGQSISRRRRAAQLLSWVACGVPPEEAMLICACPATEGAHYPVQEEALPDGGTVARLRGLLRECEGYLTFLPTEEVADLLRRVREATGSGEE